MQLRKPGCRQAPSTPQEHVTKKVCQVQEAECVVGQSQHSRVGLPLVARLGKSWCPHLPLFINHSGTSELKPGLCDAHLAVQSNHGVLGGACKSSRGSGVRANTGAACLEE